jgi:hypothetical protein
MTKKKSGSSLGRPRRDYSDDPDLVVAELAVALMIERGMSERKALDVALAWHQGERFPPSKTPRGGKGKKGVLVGYLLPMKRSFASRNADIRRKFRLGKLRPRIRVILYLARLLHLSRRGTGGAW